jgi:tetratricopeptide (TPR) repeat protein
MASAFDEANKLYEQGRYSDAVAAYRSILEQNIASAAVYFNLGNAYFKLGETGQAIASFRFAQRLDPRDPDIQANLRFARETVKGTPTKVTFWRRWSDALSTNELSIVVCVAIWIWLLLLTLGELKRPWRGRLRRYTLAAGLLAVIGVLWLAVVLRPRLNGAEAVVTERDVALRYGPLEEAQVAQTLPDGAELRVLDQKDGWLRVSQGAQRIGWVRTNTVLVLPPG